MLFLNNASILTVPVDYHTHSVLVNEKTSLQKRESAKIDSYLGENMKNAPELKELFVLSILVLILFPTPFEHSPSPAFGMNPVQTQSFLKPERMTDSIALTLFMLINEERERHGLKTLRWDIKLTRLAENHSRDMADTGDLSHISSDWKTYPIRLFGSDILYQNAGENVAFSETFIPEIIHQSLMDSSEHREEILAPEYDSVGLGVSYNSRKKGFYITQNFILSLRPLYSGTENRCLENSRISPFQGHRGSGVFVGF